jgi:hypothetical protein
VRDKGKRTCVFDNPIASGPTTCEREKNPEIAPPNAAAVGITLFSSLYIEPFRCPAITLLILKLLGNIARTAARDLNPSLGEEGTGAEDGFFESLRGRHVVGDSADGSEWG